jgi:hypothetical protein
MQAFHGLASVRQNPSVRTARRAIEARTYAGRQLHGARRRGVPVGLAGWYASGSGGAATHVEEWAGPGAAAGRATCRGGDARRGGPAHRGGATWRHVGSGHTGRADVAVESAGGGRGQRGTRVGKGQRVEEGRHVVVGPLVREGRDEEGRRRPTTKTRPDSDLGEKCG